MSELADLIPQAIRDLRKHSGMTQLELAAALHVTPTSIHRWEAGTSTPDFEMVVSLWSFALERGSATSNRFADFLTSRTEAIRPLFRAKDLPEIQALEGEIAELRPEQRHLVFALVRMLKQGHDDTAEKVIRVLLEDWKQPPSGNDDSSQPRRSKKQPESGKRSSQPKTAS